MQLIDITWSLLDAPQYPGSESPVLDRVSKISEGGDCNFSMVRMPSHCGTHADALCHFIDGSKTMDQMELEYYYGPCRVMSFDKPEILVSDIEGKLDGVRRFVIHGNGKTFVSPEAAQYLADIGVITVITDAMSVGPVGLERAPHVALLGNGVAIVETVKLDGVEDGDYIISCFPAKYSGCDGSPVRAVLIKE